MAKSLTNILSQIERLQKEAAAIQTEVVARIRKDIAKYGLSAEQLFGATGAAKATRAKASAKPAKAPKPPKYADGAGNTWGGMGKRPDWIRQALAAGKALEDLLIAKAETRTPSKARATKAAAKTKAKSAAARKPAAKRRAAAPKAAAPRKPRAKAVEAPAEA